MGQRINGEGVYDYCIMYLSCTSHALSCKRGRAGVVYCAPGGVSALQHSSMKASSRIAPEWGLMNRLRTRFFLTSTPAIGPVWPVQSSMMRLSASSPYRLSTSKLFRSWPAPNALQHTHPQLSVPLVTFATTTCSFFAVSRVAVPHHCEASVRSMYFTPSIHKRCSCLYWSMDGVLHTASPVMQTEGVNKGSRWKQAEAGGRSAHLRSPRRSAPRDCSRLAADAAKRYSPPHCVTMMR